MSNYIESSTVNDCCKFARARSLATMLGAVVLGGSMGMSEPSVMGGTG